jgi:hypothetical protein
MSRSIRSIRFLFAVAATLALASSARADFAVHIYEDGVLKGTVTSPTTTLNVSGTYGDFSLTNLTYTSNSDTALGDGFAYMSTSGTATYLGTNGVTHTLNVVASDDRFELPTPAFTITSVDSYTADRDPHGSVKFVNTVGSSQFGSDIASSLGHTFAPLKSSDSLTEDPVDYTSSVTPFALSMSFTWQTALQNGTFQPTSNVEIDPRAVPEPGSMGLVAVGLLGVLGAARRRSK